MCHVEILMIHKAFDFHKIMIIRPNTYNLLGTNLRQNKCVKEFEIFWGQIEIRVHTLF